MLDADEKEKLRPYYFKMLKLLGWNVAFDGNRKFQSNLLDAKLMLVKKDKENPNNSLYSFIEVSYTASYSYEKFGEIRLKPENGELAKLSDEVDKLLYPYDLDDVICQLLHLGYSIKDFYVVQNGKLSLKLNSKMANDLIDEFCHKGSPLLENPGLLLRPHKIKNRTAAKTFYNVDVFGKNGVGFENSEKLI